MCIIQNVHPAYKYDKKLRSCVPKSGFVYAYPFFGRSKDTSNQSGQNTGVMVRMVMVKLEMVMVLETEMVMVLVEMETDRIGVSPSYPS